jgi:hypothetical protein
MSVHPIRNAVGQIEVPASPEFREALRGRFLAELMQPRPDADGLPNSAGQGLRLDEDTDQLDELPVTTVQATLRSNHPWRRTMLRIAASIVAIAGLTAVVINQRPSPASIDTTRDPSIAEDALISVDELGARWEVSNGGLTSRAVAGVAAAVPECSPYLDFAFDTAARRAPTAGRIFTSPSWTLTQWVYIFPSESAASRAMDKIAEPGFVPCFNTFLEKLIPLYSPGRVVTATTIAAPPMLAHGDRQVVLAQDNTYRTGTVAPTRTVMNVFVQVGRGIVYIDPVTDERDSRDPAGSIEQALTAAADDLAKALATKPSG